MNTSKLKTISITACCFFVALYSEIKCMDTSSDVQETTIKNHMDKSDMTKPEGDLEVRQNMLLNNTPTMIEDENKDFLIKEEEEEEKENKKSENGDVIRREFSCCYYFLFIVYWNCYNCILSYISCCC